MASSIVSMLVGYASGYTSPAAESVTEDLSLSEDEVRKYIKSPLIDKCTNRRFLFILVFVDGQLFTTNGNFWGHTRRFSDRAYRSQVDLPPN